MLNIGEMQLKHLRCVISSKGGGTDIYRDVSAKSGIIYTVITSTSERERHLMASAAEELKHNSNFVTVSSKSDKLMLVFRYNTERLLLTFAKTQCPTVEQKLELCKKLIRECMTIKLPYWLLALSLKEENINLEVDGNVSINIFVNPEKANEKADEKLCTAACADIVCKILEGLSKRNLKKCKTYWLIYKKSINNSNTTFLQLYRDIECSSGDVKMSITAKIKQSFLLNKDKLFLFLKRIAIIFVVILILVLLQKLFFSNISLWGLRYTGLKQIGTVWIK